METTIPQRVDAALREASQRIDAADARLLLADAVGQPVSWLYAHADEFLQPASLQLFHARVQARMAGQPVAYLIGRRDFWNLDLAVTPDTLIPRPETELLVELSLARLPLHSAARVADLGTGSGAIALAIAKERPQAHVVATDASVGALAVARRNAIANDIANVEFQHGSWFVPLNGQRFDLIASNPPYIAEGDPHLQLGDLRFEPATALSSGKDGLDDIRQIVLHATSHLLPGGWLLLEHGHDQGDSARHLFDASGFVQVTTTQDLEARDRVTSGRRPDV